MPTLTYDEVLDACHAGGPSCLTSRTELAPAAGPQASVAPAKFAPAQETGKGRAGVYAYEYRFIDGVRREVVLLDSKQSQLNRAEAALMSAITDGNPLLTRIPRIEVVYDRDGGQDRYSDLELPHRAFDGHIRAGTVNSQPATDLPAYRALRDATPSNARPLLEASPATIVFGGWDASRSTRQGRWRSLLVGEVIGVCADGGTPALKGGARVDPVGMQVKLSGDALSAIALAQRGELSAKTYDKVLKEAKGAKNDLASASTLGLGGIPPSLGTLAGVACERIVRSHVLSFAALRQVRFGAEAAGDAACRALLAALALDALARADSELSLRANCDLVETGPTEVTLDRRHGERDQLEALSIEEADGLLVEALAVAEREAGVSWQGVVLTVAGNPDIVAGVVDAEEE
ncbi:MAG: type I-G CRISPR-associated RAMP protein Csb1/Cas7g [Acidimicrobiales bacterium]